MALGDGRDGQRGRGAAAMEAMRMLKAVGAQPKRTIRLALWGGEEEGLLGSKAYVDSISRGRERGGARGDLGLSER